jgi:hypothetical protein
MSKISEMSETFTDSAIKEAESNTDRFYTQVKSLHEFDNQEVRSVINNLLSKTPAEVCHLANFIRTQGNVETLLLLQKSKHVQTIAMIARALFELSVEARLLEVIPNGYALVTHYADVEKLRLANKIMAFKNANPDVTTNTTIYQQYVARESARITAIQESLWPGVNRVKHWSGMNLAERCSFLKIPFDQIYSEDYPRISWYAHPGLTGIANVQFVTFIHVCGYAFNLAVKSYEQSLRSAIRAFKLISGNDHILDRLDVALKFPFADSDEQIEVLRNRAGL